MIFADSSFFIALAMPRDRSHAQATALLERAHRQSVVTTPLIRGEVWTYLRRRLGHRLALYTCDRIGSSQLASVRRLDDGVDAEAWEWLRRHDERKYSYVDATSFAFMRANRITEALAFDGDFAAAGFIELRP